LHSSGVPARSPRAFSRRGKVVDVHPRFVICARAASEAGGVVAGNCPVCCEGRFYRDMEKARWIAPSGFLEVLGRFFILLQLLRIPFRNASKYYTVVMSASRL